MPHFSETSRRRLLTCDARLIDVCSEVIRCFDFTVVSGHRTDEEQDLLYAQGRVNDEPIITYKRGGESIHNTDPSRAVDLCPYVRGRGLVWDNVELFAELAGAIRYAAWKRGISIEWGGHWLRFVDRPHFQVAPRTI